MGYKDHALWCNLAQAQIMNYGRKTILCGGLRYCMKSSEIREQLTFNQWVPGSSPGGRTILFKGLAGNG